jgi:serine O-acetyltransferase
MSAIALWQSILDEARRAAANDPVYGAMLSRAVLSRPSLDGAIVCQIVTRLGRLSGAAPEFEAAAAQAFAAEPAIAEAAARDMEGIVRGDPASAGFLPVLLDFKGYLAVQAWRVANFLWHRGRVDIALLLQSASSSLLQVSIHPSADLGTGVFLDHGTGIVVGPFSQVGDDVTILQNVTIGRMSDAAAAAPVIGSGVLLGSGATVLGPVRVGDFAKVGAGALIDRDVPAGCTAVGMPMRLTNCPEPSRPQAA